jgi:hypothetical protein
MINGFVRIERWTSPFKMAAGLTTSNSPCVSTTYTSIK